MNIKMVSCLPGNMSSRRNVKNEESEEGECAWCFFSPSMRRLKMTLAKGGLAPRQSVSQTVRFRSPLGRRRVSDTVFVYNLSHLFLCEC